LGHTRERKLIILAVVFLATCFAVYDSAERGKGGAHIALKDSLGTFAGYTIDGDVDLGTDLSQYLDLDDYTFTGYRAGDGSKVTLFVGYYYSAEKVSAAHSPFACYPAHGWAIEQPVLQQLVVRGQTINYAEIVAAQEEKKELVLFWFQAYKSTTSYVFRNKIRVMWNKFATGNQDHAFVRVSVPFADSGYDTAKKTATDFMEVFYPKFIEFMDKNDVHAAVSPAVVTQ
jgi:EpsI family protein